MSGADLVTPVPGPRSEEDILADVLFDEAIKATKDRAYHHTPSAEWLQALVRGLVARGVRASREE